MGKLIKNGLKFNNTEEVSIHRQGELPILQLEELVLLRTIHHVDSRAIIGAIFSRSDKTLDLPSRTLEKIQNLPQKAQKVPNNKAQIDQKSPEVRKTRKPMPRPLASVLMP